MITEKQIIIAAIIVGVITTASVGIYQTQQAQATGCPIETIIPFIDDAIVSLQSGDTDRALSQMQDAKNELADTFEVEDK